ncbi:hypothetical protein [Desulfopila sp. IMCC35008]|uniref:hypothetical protein n=1 Tax=Desulfopila sp. IMCC35008 TaxID=2653858 RepID=UPI0013D6423E|nr:hypothetical protein [Desulfopila sp. IMCC35008]
MQIISGLTQTHCAYNERRAASARNLGKRLAKRFLSKDNLTQLKNGGITVLSTLAVGSLFLAGTYFFLVQLADYGW